MNCPLLAAVPLLVALLAQPASSAIGPSAGEGRVSDAIRIEGDIDSTFTSGAILVNPRTLADGLDFSLKASELQVDYYADRYWAFAEDEETVPVALQDVQDEPVHERATFTGAKLSLPSLGLEDEPTLLIFTPEGTWLPGRGSGATLRVTTADVACTLALEREATLVRPPQHAESRRALFGEDAFRFELPTPSFSSGESGPSGQTQVDASGLLRIYIWGFGVVLDSDQGHREYATGHRLLHDVPEQTGALAGVARHNEYSYVMLTATEDAVLTSLVSTRSTVWYAPEPDVSLVGAIAAEWQDATMDAGGRRYAAEGTASLQGTFALRPRHSVDGQRLEWEGDLAATSFRTTANGHAAMPGSPTLVTALQAALLLSFPLAALAVVRLRRRPRETAAFPKVAAAVGEKPAVVPAAPLAARRPAASSPISGTAPVTGTTKDNVLRLIEGKPGVHLASAAAALRIPRSIAFHHVHDLARRGLVFSVPVQGRLALFRVGHWTPEDANAQAALTSSRTRDVAMLLLERPGITIAALVDRTHMPARSVARELQRLRARGLALRDMLARPAKYHPSDRLRRLAERGEATPEVPAPVLLPTASPSTDSSSGTNGQALAREFTRPTAGANPL